jgi:hypothetical protein
MAIMGIAASQAGRGEQQLAASGVLAEVTDLARKNSEFVLVG